MKVAHTFLSKKSLINKLNKRNADRIKEFTSISPDLKPEVAAPIKENIDSIARFAARKNCCLEFVPAQDLFEGAAQVNVLKRGLSFILDYQNIPIVAQSYRGLSGQAVLADNLSGKGFMNNLRSQVKNIISNDKDWNKRFSEVKTGLF